jgi:alpha-aminoadipate carrier protein LysW
MAHCPECEAAIDVEEDDVEEGQHVECQECGAELEVVNTNPLELELVSGSDEDDEGEEDHW